MDSLVQAIASVDGVVAIILFGSRARGDYDEYSDYDLLVVFRDGGVMWKNRRKMYENVGRLGLFTQVLTRSIRELEEETEPTFLQNVLQHGVILFLRYPFTAPALSQSLRPMAVVTYRLTILPHKEKMRLIYRLFGKKTRDGGSGGIVGEGGGMRLGRGCLMVPMDGLEAVTQVLKRFNVQFKILKTYAPC